MRFVRVPCRAEWPTSPPLSSRRSMMPVHFLRYVTSPPRVISVPRTVISVEPLLENDSTPRSTGAVRAQFVINEDGRIDTATVLDLANRSREAPLWAALVTSRAAARFSPALDGTRPVPVRSQWWVTHRPWLSGQ
jgi:hypothetical protein